MTYQRKRSNYRRYGYPRRRLYNKRKPVMRIPRATLGSIVPPEMRMVIPASVEFTHTVNSGTNVSDYTNINLNQINNWAMNVTGEPAAIGWDAIKTLYERYYVYGAQTTLEAIYNNDDDLIAEVAMAPSSQILTGFVNIQSLPNSRSELFTSNTALKTTFGALLKVTGPYVNIPKYMGLASMDQIKDQLGNWTNDTAEPLAYMYNLICWKILGTSIANQTFTVSIRVKFYVHCWSPLSQVTGTQA